MVVTAPPGATLRTVHAAGVLPRWFIAGGLIAGIGLLLTISCVELLALIFPAWVAILSILLLRARPVDWEHLGTPRRRPRRRGSVHRRGVC
jgi:hypothetical protein